MKRLIAVLVVVGFIVALPLSHAFGAKADKVQICHVNSANDTLDLGFATIVFGTVIEVSGNAVPAHEAHGDSTAFEPMEEDFRDWVEATYAISLPNADCWFPVFP